MRQVRISKRNGKFRTIYVPSRTEKAKLRHLVPQLTRKAQLTCSVAVHGFMPGRSPVTNALQHVGYQFTTNFDLENFFDTVTIAQLPHLTPEEVAAVLVDGAPRQGLPTSPIVANLAASALDTAIEEWLTANELPVVYTRYADDLTFSYNDPQITVLLLKVVPGLVARCGFKLNQQKTRHQSAKKGRRIVTGVAVAATVHPTRKVRRKLRAARHQAAQAQARGLQEWCELKRPKSPLTRTLVVKEVGEPGEIVPNIVRLLKNLPSVLQ